MNEGSTSQRTAIVTGASRGLGADIARALAASGANIVLNHVEDEEQNARVVAHDLEKTGAKVLLVPCNVRDSTEVDEMIAATLAHFGGVDILVNNAGIHQHLKTHELSLADWKHVLDTNLTGTFLCSRAVLPAMKAAKSGRIVSISSLDAYAGTDHESHYAASKAGIIGFTKSLALEVAREGITVNAIAPGNILTPMLMPMTRERETELCTRIPVGRLGMPADVSRCVLFLAAAEASFITGETIHVNGGLRMS